MDTRSTRTLTEKAMEQFEQRTTEYNSKLNLSVSRLQGLETTYTDGMNLKQITNLKKSIQEEVENYDTVFEEFTDFLVRTATTDSQQQAENLKAKDKCLKKSLNNVIKQIDSRIVDLSEQISTSSRGSKSSHTSAAKAKLLYQFAQESAHLDKVKADLEQQQAVERAAQERRRAKLDTEIKLLAEKRKAAILTIDAREEDNSDNGSQVLDDLASNLPADQKIADFLQNIRTETPQHNELNVDAPAFKPKAEYSPNPNTDIAKFLLKKDLILSRLVNFNDKAENYIAWRGSFRRVMEDLSTTADEEFDMLIKYLGVDSKRHAMSLKSVYATNPVMGLTKLWARLDDQYGSPELIRAAVLNKLNTLQRFPVKEPKKLFDLLDVLLEVQALKEDPRYSTQLSYFDSSEGVLPIVHKLPYNLQEKWVTRASSYKRNNDQCFPPFFVFVNFINEIAKIKNDPGLACVSNERSNRAAPAVNVKKTEINKTPKSGQGFKCPIHKADHSLVDCRSFQAKSVSERKQIVKDNRICFRCLCSVTHKAADCKVEVKCSDCGGQKHLTLMHENRKNNNPGAYPHGGERGGNTQSVVKQFSSQGSVQNMCTQVCGGHSSGGKSCAKIVLVDVYDNANPCQRLRLYAIIDEQSNRSLASPAMFEKLGLNGKQIDYALNSCSGVSNVQGRKVSNCMVETVDGSCKYLLPPLLECSQIPDARDEIPTSHIATQFSHLRGIASKIPPLHEDAEILLLIGRDLVAAHHVHEQIIGPKNEPFAQRLGLGWVIVGQVCLGQIHQAEVNCKKTYLLPNGRESLFPPCSNNFKVTEKIPSLADDIFVKTKKDNEVCMSVEDREFVDILRSEMVKDPCGNWVAPLPFVPDRPSLPNNRSIVLKRAHMLHFSLKKNPQKLGHFLDFMDGIISKCHAEIAPPMKKDAECWYLPLFGVYHPKKPDQIRGVFDASAKFENVSLNDVLLQGTDLINSLIGILLRFRKDKVAICADIQQMFYSFLVKEEDRDFLRFFWYKENDPNKEIVEYRMRVHVFGNKPSPSVANFGLQKTAAISEMEFGTDVREFVSQNFYVDDGLISLPSVEQTVDLMKRTQSALLKNGNLRLHKIASNDESVLQAFPQEDLAKNLSCIDLSKDNLPTQRSLGLLWDLKSDCFTFSVPDVEKPFTRRGVLSVVNSLYDPLGFVAPVTIVGKLLLKSMTTGNCSWDEPLPVEYFQKWLDWIESLQSLKDVSIPRSYIGHSLSQASNNTLLLFSDASEKATASVAYLVSETAKNGPVQIGFVMGKTKVAPSKGHTIPRLELCAAVLSVEIAEQVLSQLQIQVNEVKYFTDSKVVLGYICNRKRRFYTYVANRVERILSSSKPSQWSYINTKHNPADIGTRGVSPSQMSDCMWLTGPPEKFTRRTAQSGEHFCLQNPDHDKEVRPDVICLAAKSVERYSGLDPKYLQKFSSLRRLTKTVSSLQHVCKSFNKSCECVGWHICREASSTENVERAQCLIFKAFQKEAYPKEIECLKEGITIPSSSPLLSLNPFLDEKGVLRVGGRLRNSKLSISERNPVLVHGRSYLALLLIRHFHEKVMHQGRHFTEGAVREGGFWITGGKKRVSSYIFGCVRCRKLRAKRQTQIMADLPADRLTPAPPFTYVGVDVFGPWSVVTRRTRGVQSFNKRWAVLFTCLTIRAVHVELVEEMSSSAFINALRRFISVRGNVLQFRSDRGTNFVGATSDLGIDAVNIEDGLIRDLLDKKGVTWVFNPPHASHMGGVWERMIGVVRKALDAILTGPKLQNLTHDVLATLMAEVCAIVNARPLVPVSYDAEAPEILSPSMLLTQKSFTPTSFNENLSIKDIYRAEWRRVQLLADQFWARWKSEFLTMLQSRQKWSSPKPNLKVGDVVLLKDGSTTRNQWPLAVVVEVFPSTDNKIRTVQVRCVKGEKSSLFVRPVTELVLLIENFKMS